MDRAAREGEMGERPELWRLWNALHKLFPSLGLISDSFVTPGAWGYVGVDFVSGFRRNPSTRKAFALLEGVDDALFDGLTALAALNARRQEQLLRAVVILYLTMPLSIAALLADIAGDSIMAFLKANQPSAVAIGILATSAPLGYMMSTWRSRQLIGVLDLIRIERDQRPFTALELRDE